jgi:hypothetical protein
MSFSLGVELNQIMTKNAKLQMDALKSFMHATGTKLNHSNYSKAAYMKDFKASICSFAFFVMIWFNSTPKEKLIDPAFPRRFQANLMKYYNYYIDDAFLTEISK